MYLCVRDTNFASVFLSTIFLLDFKVFFVCFSLYLGYFSINLVTWNVCPCQ
jgi:hypothetical protein